MSSPLSSQAREKLARTLADWGAQPAEIEDVLADAVVGPGAIALRSDEDFYSGDFAVLVDPATDPEVDELLRWRAKRSRREVAASIKISEFVVRTFLCPFALEALLAVGVEIARPWSLRRTFLLLMGRNPTAFGLLALPGTPLWLAPVQVATRLWAEEGAGSTAEFYENAIPIAQTTGYGRTILPALQHLQPPAFPPPEEDDSEPEELDEPEPEPERGPTQSWEDVKRQLPKPDPYLSDFLRRVMAIDSMLLQLCRHYDGDEQAVMKAAGIMHEDDFVPITDHYDGLYIARIGRIVAHLGGRLELHAIYPNNSHLLLAEPGRDEPGSVIDSDADPPPQISDLAGHIGWRASPYHLDDNPNFAPIFQRLAQLEDTLWQIITTHGHDPERLMSNLHIPHTAGHAHIPIPEHHGLYIANLGLLLALTNGHLELHARFPERTHLLNAEPGPEHLTETLTTYHHQDRVHKRR